MNSFRLLGDFLHLLAIIVLLVKILWTRSCSGISGKSQVLYAMVFTTRYLDLFIYFISVYNTTLKIIFILTTYATLFLMFYKFRSTYDSHHDTFRAELLVVSCGGLALLINHDFTLVEILWTFSIYLESVALMPQVYMVSKAEETEHILSYYFFVLGLYRASYIVNWVYRYYHEDYYDIIAIVSGCVQTILTMTSFIYITYKVFLAEHKETKEVFTIEQRETSPPYVPRICSARAASNFDSEFTKGVPPLSPVDDDIVKQIDYEVP